MKKSHRVVFQPEGRTVFVMDGTLVLEAATEAGLTVDAPCGGRGVCGKCRVQIVQGDLPESAEQKERIGAELYEQGYRLACQTRITSDMTIVVPRESRLFEQKILTEGADRATAVQPNVRKVHIEEAPPTLEDQACDADRLLRAIPNGENLEAPIDLLRQVSDVLRESSFSVTAVINRDEIIAVEPGDTTSDLLGAAFDIGTTTVVGMLVDLRTGERLAVASRTNPQVQTGDDVISRIEHTRVNASGLRELQSAIVGCVNDILEELVKERGISVERIYEVTTAGNTTMTHLLLGVPPRYLAEAPYVGVFRKGCLVRARDIGVRIHPQGKLYALPNIAGFVGGDTVAVVLATGMMQKDEVCLAIDVGTNGEMVLGSREWMVSCSTAAGPAFEGARIRFGMRASQGAIEKILINDDVSYNVIGNVAPIGICGTALIDLLAELRRVGVVDETGRILTGSDLPGGLPPRLAERVQEDDDGPIFVLAEKEEAANGRRIYITQRDVRELQLAKGAILAGVMTLLKEANMELDDIHEILLAGAFGNFIRRKMAKRIGFLPQIPSERIRFVGNAAGAGARLALVSRACRDEAERISRHVKYIELAGRPDFQIFFGEAMMFPEVVE